MFKIECTDNKRKLCAVDFLPTSQKFIKIYPEHNLIVTPDSLYTLQGELILCENIDLADIIYFPHNLLICAKSQHEKIRILMWNGKEITHDIMVEKLLHNDKYIAALCKNWNFFDVEGKPILTIDRSTPYIRMGYDLVVFDEIGNHNVYSLKTGECIMQSQQIVEISSWCNFAIGVDLKRKATIYCEGNISYFFEVSFIGLVDEAQLFYVSYGKSKTYVVYDCKNLEFFAENADIISYDEESNTLLIASPPQFCKYKVSSYYTMSGIKRSCIIPYENNDCAL
ncbi:MAG: hypothetical protein IJ677_09005 [Alphaproteobacteria bacterium]|nr:hypothetical protein [Alphaproteobacteria bacterium]